MLARRMMSHQRQSDAFAGGQLRAAFSFTKAPAMTPWGWRDYGAGGELELAGSGGGASTSALQSRP
jgi:hypothetical protein